MNAGNITKISREQALKIARNYLADPENNCSGYTVESVSTIQELDDVRLALCLPWELELDLLLKAA